VQLAPEASVPQLLAWRKGFVTFTELRDVLELKGLVTVTVPDAQANMISELVESVTKAPLPLSGVDLLDAPVSVNSTAPFRSPPAVRWNVGGPWGSRLGHCGAADSRGLRFGLTSTMMEEESC